MSVEITRQVGVVNLIYPERDMLMLERGALWYKDENYQGKYECFVEASVRSQLSYL